MIQQLCRYQITCDNNFCDSMVKSEDWVTETVFVEAVLRLGWSKKESDYTMYFSTPPRWHCPQCSEGQ